MLQQYRLKNQRSPTEIVLTPLAAVVLTVKEGLPTVVEGIRVTAKDFGEKDIVKDGSRLGVLLREDALRQVDLS